MSLAMLPARPRVLGIPGAGTRRGRTLLLALICAMALAGVAASAWALGDSGLRTNFAARWLPPSMSHLFGTDALGRDLLARTMKGLTVSLRIGFFAATASALIAAFLATLAATHGGIVDATIGVMIDAALGLPHLVMLILISFALGGGTTAVIIAVAVTHWPQLTRIMRAEMTQVIGADYVLASRQFGRSWSFIARHHLLPHALPQMLVGLVLLFPHAILHEAGLTFLGFGIEPSKPAIGILLSESMRTISAGYWWLGVFPGLSLLLVVLTFNGIAGGLRAALNPREAQD